MKLRGLIIVGVVLLSTGFLCAGSRRLATAGQYN